MDVQNATLDSVLSRVRAYRQAEGLSFSALAMRAGLSRSALVGMDDPDWSPTATTLRAIEALMAFSPAVAATTEAAPDRVVGEDSLAAPQIGTTPAVRPVVVSLAVLEEPAAQQGAEPATRHEGGREPSPRHQESDPSHER